MNRAALLSRHNPCVTGVDSRSPLQLGNGQFALAVDVTGLQTFPEAYPGPGGGTLLGTMSQWGWHSMAAEPGWSIEHCLHQYDTPRGSVPYADLSQQLWGSDDTAAGYREGTPEEVYFRANPQRIDLGRIGLDLPAGVGAADLAEIEQRLDLASGKLFSSFIAAGARYEVTTVVDMETDSVAVNVHSPDAASVGIRISFPYASQHPENAQDWDHSDAHSTVVAESTPCGQGIREWAVRRVMDQTTYFVEIATAAEVRQVGAHQILITATSDGSAGADLAAVIRFVPLSGQQWAWAGIPAVSVQETMDRTARAWQKFWAGGAVELAGSDHPQALELERRIVLSRYLTRINSAGLLPVAETGLYANSWRGKFHLEMQWWHLAHFALWGQPELVEQVLGWYDDTLDSGRQIAQLQGYPGARWLKSSGPEARQTPSSIAAFLLWQQPHPIYLAELVRRAKPGETVRRWWPVVSDTARFMAAYPIDGKDLARWQSGRGHTATDNLTGLVFPPPLIPSQECYASLRQDISQPTYELAYWVWALRTAAAWADAMGEGGLADDWRAVAARIHVPAPIRRGQISSSHRTTSQNAGRLDPDEKVYPSIAMPPWTERVDHPSVLAALGITPDTGLIDPRIMATTLADIRTDWDWPTTWGWDYPMMAMTATRVGQPAQAVDCLLLDLPKNTYLPNGHNWQTPNLPAYLPGNGGLLTAIALMTAGWDGGPGRPGFGPEWVVDHEGILPLP